VKLYLHYTVVSVRGVRFLSAVFVVVAVLSVFPASPVGAQGAGGYVEPEWLMAPWYVMNVTIPDYGPHLVFIRVSYPAWEAVFGLNATVRSRVREVMTLYHPTAPGASDAIRVALHREYVEEDEAPAPGANITIRAEWTEKGGGRVTDVMVGPDGEVMRHVVLACGPYIPLEATVRCNATFYGTDFEGRSLSDIRAGLPRLLGNETEYVVPYLAAHPPWLVFGNRSVEVIRVEERGGKYYASFNITDRNDVLPEYSSIRVSLREWYAPLPGGGYAHYLAVNESYVWFVYMGLVKKIDGVYREFMDAVAEARKGAYMKDSYVYRRLYERDVIPVEERLGFYVDGLAFRIPPELPRDPFFWYGLMKLLVTRATYNVSVQESSELRIEAPPPECAGNLTCVALRAPRRVTTVTFGLLWDSPDRMLAELCAFFGVLMGVDFGEALKNPAVATDMDEWDRDFVVILGMPADIHDLYDITVRIPILNDRMRAGCEEGVYPNITKIVGGACVIYSPQLPSGITVYLHDMISPRTEEPGITTTAAQGAGTAPQTTQAAGGTGTQAAHPTATRAGPLPAQDILYWAAGAAAIILATIAAAVAVRRKS